MNANQAQQHNETLVNEMFNGSKEMSIRLGITIEQAIDKKVSAYLKYSKTSTESTAWILRGADAKKLINKP